MLFGEKEKGERVVKSWVWKRTKKMKRSFKNARLGMGNIETGGKKEDRSVGREFIQRKKVFSSEG